MTDPIKADFRNLLFLIWKHLRLPSPTPIQYAMAHYLQHGPPRRCLKGFRGVGKSWIAAAFVIWFLLLNPDETVVVRSASKPRADAFIQFCLRLISEMPELRHLLPRPGQRMSSVAFDVGPARINQTPSCVSIGIFGQATGHRATLLVDDDVEIPGNSETVVQREKLAGRFDEGESLVKPVDEGGQRIVLCTDQTEDSIYRGLPDKGFEVKLFPARFPEKDTRAAMGDSLAPVLAELLDKDPLLAGKPTEPSRFHEEELQRRELGMGRVMFRLQFLLDPRISDADQYPLRMADLIVHPLDASVAPERLIWCGSNEYALNDLPCVGLRGDRIHRGLVPPNTDYKPYTGTVMYIDPAGRGKDETAYAVTSVLNGIIYLRGAGAYKGYEQSTLESLSLVAKQFQVKKVLVEPNFGDGMFTTLLKPVMARIYPVTVEDAERAVGQKEKRICDALGPVVASHRLVVDHALIQRDYDSVVGVGDGAFLYRLWYQFTHITRERGCLKHDDRLDALAGAVAYWQQAVGLDTEKAVEKAREKARDEELRKFIKVATKRTMPKPSWISKTLRR